VKKQKRRFIVWVLAASGVVAFGVVVLMDQALRRPTVSHVSVLRQSVPDVSALTAANTTVVVGNVVATDDSSYERVPNDSEEGVAPGDGSDVYGTITLRPTEVLKGTVDGDVTIAFKSGKRDPVFAQRKRLMRYTYDNLRRVQGSNGKLLEPDEIRETYVVFLLDNSGYFPQEAGKYVLDPIGFAVKMPDDHLSFDGNPFTSGSAQPSIDEIRKAVNGK
jgi:hypothetical protein